MATSELVGPGGEDPRRVAAGKAAVDCIAPGMVVGLGTGRTAIWAVRRLAEQLRQRSLTDVVGVPTSLATAQEARRLGIPLTSLEAHPRLDLVIDGADEVDPDLNLIKGGGGALLREKIVAQAGRRRVIVVDAAKMSPQLGTKGALPVEVVPFGWKSQRSYLEHLGAHVALRRDANRNIFETDQGNYILDCQFGPIPDAAELGQRIKQRSGIVEHGLFLQMTTDLIVAGPDGIQRYGAVSQNGPSME
ncbi:MAG: ribose 5-phosphate isomerase A [Desulfosarcinaceae bacterium]|nr:ribose 5-phosphate isomerase A [Desulfosarcinaceae bacterium]